MLKLRDLAVRDDFRVGPLCVSPSRRRVQGPGGEVHLEPLIMHVFLLLLDAGGRVVTRDELFDQCWGAAAVGDDSLNRAVARVRQAGAQIAPGLFEIETIPRTGYRLTGEILGLVKDEASESPTPKGKKPISRRSLIAGGAAAIAAGAAGLWWNAGDRSDPRAAAHIDRGRRQLQAAMPGNDERAADQFRAAVRLENGNALGWGLLSLALRNIAESSPPERVSQPVIECEAAARKALALDPKEPNARTALATVRPEFGNWGATEDALRSVLRDSPDNGPALAYLTMTLQAVGKSRESWVLNERAIAVEPLSPVHQFRRALKQWIAGRVSEADITVDRALQLWPKHPGVWNARLMIFAFTGRAGAALGELENRVSLPPGYPSEMLNYWRVALRALESRAPADIGLVRRASVERAPKSAAVATASMMVLSSLGDVDTAFAIADGTLLRQGPLIGAITIGRGESAVTDFYWRRTMNLFTPATAAMRDDPRFRALCDGMEMTAYWRERGGPDPMYRLSFA